MQQIKTTELPVGSAIARLVKLEYISRATHNRPKEVEHEINSLIEALNAFEISLSFDCQTDSDGDGIPDAIEEAEGALDLILSDAQTQCCKISDKTASMSSRADKATTSRGD